MNRILLKPSAIVPRPSRLAVRLAAVLVPVLLFLLLSPPALAQTVSEVDTIRIVNVTTEVNDSFYVDVYLRNVDSLGSFTYRLEFNEAVIEPLTDTVADVITIEAEALRGVGQWENFSGSLPSAGVLTFIALNYDIGADAVLPGRGIAVRMNWRVVPGASAQSASITFVNDPDYAASYNTITDSWASVFKRPQLINGVVTITEEGGGGGEDNDPPTIPALSSPLSVNQGDLLTFSVQATDPDGDSLSLLAFNLPSGATFVPSNPVRGKVAVTGTFRWTPSFSQSGAFTVSFQATDSAGLTSTIRNVTINVEEVPTDRLYTTSVAGQDPKGGVPGAVNVVIPVNFTQTQQSYGVQFDFVYDATVFTPTSLQATDKLDGFSIYDDLDDHPGRLRVVAFSLTGDPIASGSSTVLFNVIGNIAAGASPGAYDIKFENAWESVNPDPNVASVALTTTDGSVYVDYFGDVNLDGRIDVADVVALVGYILGDFEFTSRQFGAGDVVTDAMLDVFDLVAIINTIFGSSSLSLATAGIPAKVELVHVADDGAHGAYYLTATVPTDVAGVQIEIDYDPSRVDLAAPECLDAAAHFMLRSKDDGKGHLRTLLLYIPDRSGSRIPAGTNEILRIPVAASSDDQHRAAQLSMVKLADPEAGRIEVTGVGPVPRDFVLAQNYPNPFNAATTISFVLSGDDGLVNTRLEIFNVLGQSVRTLVDEPLASGHHSRIWDGTDHDGTPVASGLYFYRLTSGKQAESKKMVLLK